MLCVAIITCWEAMCMALEAILTCWKAIGKIKDAIMDGCDAILMDWRPYQHVGRSYGLDRRP